MLIGICLCLTGPSHGRIPRSDSGGMKPASAGCVKSFRAGRHEVRYGAPFGPGCRAGLDSKNTVPLGIPLFQADGLQALRKRVVSMPG